MGYKQTEKVIVDYFSELLSDNTISTQSTGVKRTEQKGVESANLKTKNIEIESVEVKSVEVKSVEVKNTELSSADNVTVKQKQANDAVTKINVDNGSPKYTHDTQESGKSKKIVESVASTDQPRARNNPLVSTTSGKTANKSTIVSNTIQETSTTKTDKEETLAAAAYEQHKQRLEKMLMQVSAVESTPPKKIATSEEPVPVKTEVEPHPPKDEREEESVQADYSPLPILSSEWLDNGRPNWAQNKFDILLIEVNGLQLAVPLVALGQIQPMDEKLTPLFGQSDWFMGLQQSPAGNVKTVNTAKFVMPERYKDEHNYKFVVSINGSNWGLAVDCIHQPIVIDPDSIRWRTKRSSRPWMAGMVKDHMCVLLDIPSMGELLQNQDKNHRQTTGG